MGQAAYREPAAASGRREAEQEPRYFSGLVSEARRFFLDLNPASGKRLTVVSGGCEHCLPDYRIRRSGFRFSAVEFVARGAGWLWLGGRDYRLMPGTVFVYAPGHPHHIRCDPANPLVKYFAVFTGQAGTTLLRECRLAPGRVLRVAQPGQIQQVFDDLIRHGRSDHANRARLCTVALQYLIMKIGDEAMPCDANSGRAFATYQRCRQFIEDHFEQVTALRQAADACHVNLSYLCRLFQRFGRESPSRYLQHLRLNRAAELLQGSGRLVKEVADELGFNDPFTFSRAFQRAFGLAPDHVRRPLAAGRPPVRRDPRAPLRGKRPPPTRPLPAREGP